METVKSSNSSKITHKSFYRKTVFNILNKMNRGQLLFRDIDGKHYIFGDGKGFSANIEVKNESFYKKCVLSGDIGFGEAYVDGMWNTSSIKDVILWMIDNIENNPAMSGGKTKQIFFNLLSKFQRLKHLLNANSRDGSKKNISYHYDLSNDFYSLWLDETMTYSSGIFKEKNNSLKEAQENKYARICEMLNLKSGMTILEIGCGWGGFAEYVTSHFDVKIKGITISNEQYEYAKKRVSKLESRDNIEICFEDYRDTKGKFDRIVSIEMIEAVGHDYYPEYFKTLNDKLADDGLVCIQAITSPDSRYNEFKNGTDWIQKHIFPGSLLPAIGEINRVLNKYTDLHMLDIKDMGHDYSKTLALWFERFTKQKDKLLDLKFDDYFIRKWSYYLQYCDAAFHARNISVTQITLTRANNRSIISNVYDS